MNQLRLPLSLIALMAIIFSCDSKSQTLEPPKVDKRVELLSITFRLAGADEYSSERYPDYVEKINTHFEPYKNHQAIQFIKDRLRRENIGFDAVMLYAISISDSYPFTPLIDFDTEIRDERWKPESARRFLELLNEFYEDASVNEFFEDNEGLYEFASSNFQKVFEELDVDWYSQFYGEDPKDEFRIVNGLGNGGGNFGPSLIKGDSKVAYAIMGTWSVDSLGVPNYPVEAYFPTLLHEFNHSFVNHVVEKYHPQLEESGKKLLKPIKKEMYKQAYQDWTTMMAEAVVRAAVVKYLRDHEYPEEVVEGEVQEQIDRSFWWTRELALELDRYTLDRETYPTLESFMPEIVKFFERKAEQGRPQQMMSLR